MATRFYLSSTMVPPLLPGFAAWTRTSEGLRRVMHNTKDGSAATTATFWAGASSAAADTCLCRQFHSLRNLKVGTVFATTDTVKVQIRCAESATNDNINKGPICIKVYNGTTLQATLLGLGHVGASTTEWPTALTNRSLANSDVLAANYTTVVGDYLVLEVGGMTDSIGTSVTGSMSFGSDNATDLGENESDTTAFNPWFEMSNNLEFAPVARSQFLGNEAVSRSFNY